jgi:hypothetical protein
MSPQADSVSANARAAVTRSTVAVHVNFIITSILALEAGFAVGNVGNATPAAASLFKGIAPKVALFVDQTNPANRTIRNHCEQ